MKLLTAGPPTLLLPAPRRVRRRTARGRHIISVGGGIASTLILPLWVREQYPRDEIVMLMAKLPNEDPDVWRLCDAVCSMIGVEMEYIGTHRQPFDAFYEQRFLGNSRIDPCSKYLKRQVIGRWMTNHYHSSDVMYVGIGAYEAHRWEAVYTRWADSGVRVEMPLMQQPHWTRESQMQFCRDTVGFVPRLYKYGFNHNNCGGACVKAGQREWARLLYYLPDVYDWWERQEHEFRKWIKRNVAILKKTKHGTSYPLTLRTLRRRMQWQWSRRGYLPGLFELMEFDTLPGVDALESSPPCAFCMAAG
jgi:hypothetical protein